MGIKPKELHVYEQASGKKPFEEWLFGLRDKTVIARIVARLNRVAHGNIGDVKSLGEGLNELRLAFGAGYRVYFTFDGSTLVVLLSGGDKGSQTRDIKQAREFLEDYRSRT
jgi:putative addiction module killer protein